MDLSRIINGVFLIILGYLLVPSESTWWFISQLPLHAVGAGILCDNIPGLVGKQKRLCRMYPGVMVSLGEGAKMGIKECQSQFSNHRWNCSTLDRDSSVFGKVMLKDKALSHRKGTNVKIVCKTGGDQLWDLMGLKERRKPGGRIRLFVIIRRSCARNNTCLQQRELIQCGCDPAKDGRSRDRRGWFEWGGCSDDVGWGSRFSRMFIDARERKVRDARALMNLHNNRAGRSAVKKFMKLSCKCHGVSGACTIRTCWLAMQSFRRVGDYLKKKYNGATQVMMNQEGSGLIVANRNHKRATKKDLVYLEGSPDFCINDLSIGSLGTAGRQCNKSSLGTDGCDIMCCGRGYDTKTVTLSEKCHCKFHWCCHVRCKKCSRRVDVHTCKGPNPTSSDLNNSRRGFRH